MLPYLRLSLFILLQNTVLPTSIVELLGCCFVLCSLMSHMSGLSPVTDFCSNICYFAAITRMGIPSGAYHKSMSICHQLYRYRTKVEKTNEVYLPPSFYLIEGRVKFSFKVTLLNPVKQDQEVY